MLNPFPPAFPYTSFVLCDRWHRCNMAVTVTLLGQGAVRGKWEPVLCYGHDLNVDLPLRIFRTAWHGVYFKNLDLFTGTGAYMASKDQGSWLHLQQAANQDVVSPAFLVLSFVT
jgi:hypothetical protein